MDSEDKVFFKGTSEQIVGALWVQGVPHSLVSMSYLGWVRQWAKREKEDLDTLSEWVKNVKSLIQIRIIKKSSVGL